ncbi:oocyte zinc finger protein XlCOF22-like [Ranitomeya imitator]|uniref:oocyte zinc finger protein XlCOF22-like n=1 Tax=Ranitomeya imitator TaxID=111125 RepID=UPI0037E832CD
MRSLRCPSNLLRRQRGCSRIHGQLLRVDFLKVVAVTAAAPTAEGHLGSEGCTTVVTDKAKWHIVKHQRTLTEQKPFSCSECGNSFNRKVLLVRHQSREKPFSCSEGGKCFNRKSDLVNHQRTHMGRIVFPIQNVGNVFNGKQILIIIKELTHRNCGKCFKWKIDRDRHQRTLTGEKPFSCSKCGNCFNRKAVLVRHQSSHTEEKPFSVT